jgi:hypothetical protein
MEHTVTELGPVARWMSQTWLGEAGRDVFWLFPAAEIVHFFGLCLMLGALLLIDLRVLGYARRVSLKQVLAWVPVAGLGLALNILSGIVFLCASPENYFPSTAFRLKMIAVFAGVFNALWFKWMEEPRILAATETTEAGARAKVVAFMSLSIWIVVIAIGRLLPYVSKSTS